MLLTRPRTAARLLAALLLTALFPLALPACGVRLDDSGREDRAKRAAKTEAAGISSSVSAAASTAGPESLQPMAGRRGPFGLRLDGTAQAKWLARSERLAGDPRALPSYGDMRQARALAMAEAEIISKGGNLRVASNGASSQPHSVAYVHSPGALTLQITAANDLNAVDGVPQALLLSVYHLSSRTAVDRLTQTAGGFREMLSGEKFDASVVAVKSVYVQPGMTTRLVVDRPETGRYVAIAAGYAAAGPEAAVYLTQYGLGAYQADAETIFHSKRQMYAPLPLNLEVGLKPGGMSVVNNDAVYHYSHRAVNMTQRQMYQSLYNRHRLSGAFMEDAMYFQNK